MTSTYGWPGRNAGGRRDGRGARRRWNAARGLGQPAMLFRAAAAAPGGAGGAADIWFPVGPHTVLSSDEFGTPRVTGRVRDVQVEPKAGQRAYAASATGGIWYTDDRGATWRPLGGFRSADPAARDTFASPNALGCLLVRWGVTAGADDPTKDEVWVGTGEGGGFTDGMPGDQLVGIGVLHGTDPTSKPVADPAFVVEATNLLGATVSRVVAQPGAAGLVAATSKGLFARPAGAGPHVSWDAVAGFPKNGKSAAPCVDAVWTQPAGGQPGRLWVAIRRTNNDIELHVRIDGTNVFTQVPLPNGAGNPNPHTTMALTASPTGDVVWALGSAAAGVGALPPSSRLWRIDTTTAPVTLALVRNGPTLWNTADISSSKIAVAVDPSAPNRIALAGTTFPNTAAASLYLDAVTALPAGNFAYPAAAAYVGREVHADVLAIRFTDDGQSVWVACDGGVFVSTAAGAAGSFTPRNTGLVVTEAGFVAGHPSNDVALVLGAQDNATQRRIGETVWGWEQGGDGGGVAFDQVQTERYIAQYSDADWSNGKTPPGQPVPAAARATEDSSASFYSLPATIVNGAVNQLAVGTDRVWYSENWGTGWVTLPTNTDPLAGQRPTPPTGAGNFAQDVVPGGSGAIRILRWATPNRLWVLCSRGLHRLDRVAGAWQPRVDISLKDVFHPSKSTDVSSSDKCNDLAVHDPARGAHGSVYLALTGDLSAEGDEQLWWFDGAGKWHRTGLRRSTTAAAVAVAVEPAHPETVYVGTTIGVFRSTLTFNGNDPVWTPFTRLDNGLPDVAVQDLAIYSNGPVRLLRAATQARGVWELDLTGPVADRTYLRVHPYDSRRTLPTSLVAPFEPRIPDPAHPPATVPTTYPWHASPDVRVHPKLGAMAAPGTLPWTRATNLSPAGDPVRFWRLWRFQVALRNVDRRSRPTGTWDRYFDTVVQANGGPVVGGNPRLTAGVWTTIVTGANLARQPWDTAAPTEADLLEYVPPAPTVAGDNQPSVDVLRGQVTVHVLLHNRGFPDQAGGDVQATLLWRRVTGWLGKPSTTWLPANVGWAAGITNLLTNGAAPALAGGWRLADQATPRRSLTGDLSAGAPRSVSFDVNLGGAGVPAGSLIMLVAVVHTPRDPAALAEAPLRQLTLGDHHVAVRSVRVR
ncbi:hypothetical protein [Mycolicibacterium stellerae]|uniref:hypothetical protein n=1 Tax=Mycolicibacterium stellerae TaxID=2358193 RepID=UPI000F0B4497|nr:hypothetical protein [Mycolicibacterium stellerae]